MKNSNFSQTQQQNNKLPDGSILSKIANVPSEATKFLSEPREYAKKHDLQLSQQVLKEVDFMACYDIPDECMILQLRNPFTKRPLSTCRPNDKYQPDICPIVTVSAATVASFAAGAAAAGLVGGLFYAAATASNK